MKLWHPPSSVEGALEEASIPSKKVHRSEQKPRGRLREPCGMEENEIKSSQAGFQEEIRMLLSNESYTLY